MNSLKDIWSQFRKFIRLDKSLYVKISYDRYESGNALIIVILSLLAIYIPLVISSSTSNFADIVFYGIVDGIFAWLFANLGVWFLLTRAFNQQIELSTLLIFTGYTHGLIGFIGLLVIANSYISIMSNILQISVIVIFGWMYFVLSNSLKAAFLFENRIASITSVTFLFILIMFSDPIRIFV